MLHPSHKDLSLGTPMLHPSDKDLSLGTPVLAVWAETGWCWPARSGTESRRRWGAALSLTPSLPS
jgi:hypothetical protein